MDRYSPPVADVADIAPATAALPGAAVRRRPRRWESAVAWAYFVVQAVDSVAFAIVVALNWHEFQLAFDKDPIASLALLIPLLSLVAALLLVRMSRWAPVMLVAHLLVAQAYIALRGSGAQMSPETLLSLAIKAVLLLFCLHLSRQGKLR